MKITMDLSESLLNRAKLLSQHTGITLNNLIEEGLSRMIEEKDIRKDSHITPVTFKGKGLSREFRHAGWSRIREASYQQL